jgi:hypothetical protein
VGNSIEHAAHAADGTAGTGNWRQQAKPRTSLQEKRDVLDAIQTKGMSANENRKEQAVYYIENTHAR